MPVLSGTATVLQRSRSVSPQTADPHARQRRASVRPPRSGGPSLEITTLDLQRSETFTDREVALPDLIGGPAPSRLQWQVNVVQYPDGLRVSGFRRPGGGRSPFSAPTGRADVTPTVRNREDSSIQRSKRIVVHRSRCLQAQYLWTFTKRGKFATSAEVWKAWQLFRQSMRRRYKRVIPYVGVPELHSDGETWHLHIAFAEWIDVIVLRILWFRALGGVGNERGDETPGNVDAKRFRGRKRAGGMGRYIAKYVGKGFERGEVNRRVFRASVGLQPKAVAVWHSPYEFDRQEMALEVAGVLYKLGWGFARGWFYERDLLEGFVMQL